MKQGKLYVNNEGRYQINDTEHYFTSGDIIALQDEEGVWLHGRIEHDSQRNCYYAIVRVNGWCGVEQEEEFYNLSGWIARKEVI